MKLALRTLLVTVLTVAALALPAAALSAPAKLWSLGEGSGPGQVSIPRGIAADPDVPGHVYLADQGNQRIQELDAWGQFVRAWGWGVVDGANEFQICTPDTTCQQGSKLSEPGGFATPQGIAVDSEGDVYVEDLRNHRVQKFDSEGTFLFMLGAGVNQGPHNPGNICTAANLSEGDVCGAGSTGSGPGEFQGWNANGSRISVDSSNTLSVADSQRIQKFTSSGSFIEEIKPPTIASKGGLIRWLAQDGLGNYYVAMGLNGEESQPDVEKLSPSGGLICTMKVFNPKGIAVEGSGDVLVENQGFMEVPIERFSSGCANQSLPFAADELQASTGLGIGSACHSNGSNVYASSIAFQDHFVNAYGPAPTDPACPPPARPPLISDQFATSVNSSAAVVKATVNPRFWKDTSFYVEYGEGKCSEGGCDRLANAPGAQLGAGVVDEAVVTSGVSLQGLDPDTEYHYRFVAQSSGGGPVKGVGGTVSSDGPEATFTTTPAPTSTLDSCPNAAFREGPGTRLADCRAYEMVSPVDKAGSDILTLLRIFSDPARFDKAAAGGDSFTYSTYRAFGDAQFAPYMSQYLARRTADGWSNHSISPPREGPSVRGAQGLNFEYKQFSEDLSQAWLVHEVNPVLAPGAVAGYSNLYRRDNASGSYTALSTEPVGNTEPEGYEIEMQGMSADGSHAIFTANDNVPPAVKVNPTTQLYQSVDGVVSPVCILPNGTRTKQFCTAGTQNTNIRDRVTSADNAISADGSRIFWTAMENSSGLGKIYLRADGAVTLAVSDSVNPGSPPTQARYLTAAADGSKAIFSVSSDLYEFDVDTATPNLIAGKVGGVAGASEDASRIYLTSREVLGSDPGPQAGEDNLYLYDAVAGSFDFVATLGGMDSSSSDIPSLTSPQSRFHVARATADGMHLAFMSRASLTGAEQIDANNGEPTSEVYLYDAGAKELVCVSCNRTGARPAGVNIQKEERLSSGPQFQYWVSGQIPAAETQLYYSRVLSEDGGRLFFQSTQPLASGDTNGKRDVYEWEAEGKSSCDDSDVTYDEGWSGCVSLISSGESPQDSRIIDASADGGDVYFTTTSSLVSQDPGLIDIYDARAGGGFPPPPEAPAQCEGEACQGPPRAPDDPTPASAATRGAGNVAPTARKKRCNKAKRAKRKGRARCGRQSKKPKQAQRQKGAR